MNKIKLNQDELTIFQKENDKNAHFCKECEKAIFYDTIEYHYSKDKRLIYTGKTYNIAKTINNVIYNICLCKLCLLKKEPDFQQIKNQSKIFNTCNKFAQIAFNIPENVKKEHNKKGCPTLKNLINKYGLDEGTKRFKEYSKKQSYSNSFEYFQKKRNWTLDQFHEYNKSRGITLENLIKKHGEEKGKEIFKKYSEQQSYTNSKEYFLEKYGPILGEERYTYFNKHRSHTLENYIERLGETDGKLKYEKYWSNFHQGSKFYSKSSQEYFKNIDEFFKEYHTYYASKNKEFGKHSNKFKKYFFIDYFIKELNIGIEYNGCFWHADPLLYDGNKIMPIRNIEAKKIWEYDELKIKAFKDEYDIDLIIVWENKLKTIEEIKIEINNILEQRKDDTKNKLAI